MFLESKWNDVGERECSQCPRPILYCDRYLAGERLFPGLLAERHARAVELYRNRRRLGGSLKLARILGELYHVGVRCYHNYADRNNHADRQREHQHNKFLVLCWTEYGRLYDLRH